MANQAIVVSKDFTFRVSIVVRNEPLTGKFSYTLWDDATKQKTAVQTQFDSYDEVVKGAATAVRNLLVRSAEKAETSIIQQLQELGTAIRE